MIQLPSVIDIQVIPIFFMWTVMKNVCEKNVDKQNKYKKIMWPIEFCTGLIYCHCD